MSIVCEIAFAPPRLGEAACSAVDAPFQWQDLPELESLDLYTPAASSGADPHVDDGPAPACLALLAFPSIEALYRAAHHARFKTGLRVLGTNVLTCTAMQRSEHAVAGAAAPVPLAARFSYVVRYHPPGRRRGGIPTTLPRYTPAAARLLTADPQRPVLCAIGVAAPRRNSHCGLHARQ